MSRTPPAILAQSLGLSAAEVAMLPKGEVYFAKGAAVTDRSALSTPRADPALVATHRYPLGAQEPRRVPGGGVQRTVTVDEFPISRTMSGSLLEIEPGGLRELHWHPAADEWQYYIEGTAEMSVFLAGGVVVTERFEAGDAGYVPMGAGHYIKNTGPAPLRVLVGFNSPRYESNDLSAWLAGNPVDILATNLGLPEDVAAKLPKEAHVFLPG
jgi:oxalate decarboxylase